MSSVDQEIDFLIDSGDISSDSNDDRPYEAIISDELWSSDSSDSDISVLEESAASLLRPQGKFLYE